MLRLGHVGDLHGGHTHARISSLRNRQSVTCKTVYLNSLCLSDHKKWHVAICVVGMTPLNMACNRRNSAIAKIFIAANAIVNLADATGNLPLHYIARCGDVNVARLLLDGGMYTQQSTNGQCSSYRKNVCV